MGRAMAIHNIFSKRRAALERSADDVYTYDVIPATLRSQLKQLFLRAYQNYKESRWRGDTFQVRHETLEAIVDALRMEYGKDELVSLSRNKGDELLEFIDQCETDQFLDCAEFYGRLIFMDDVLNDDTKKKALFELNHRFREAALGYEFLDGKIVRIDSQLLHAEVLKPTIFALSSNPIYQGAEQEILQAFEKYRAHDNKGAVADALKAFESTLKAVLDKRGWAYNAHDTAAKLIAACFTNGLIPPYMQTHFGGLRTMLESGVPTVRNKTSGHGQGATVKPLADHFASYVLYTALANMKLVIDCEKQCRE